jgi:hypothetical protein
VSILGAVTADDQKSGRGAALPPGTYKATIESAEPKELGGGTALKLMLGNLRTKDGATTFDYRGASFVIGNRKVFASHWLDHSNPEAAKVGHSFIKKLLISAGVIENSVGAEDPYTSTDELVADIVGKDVTIVTKLRSYKGSDGEMKSDPDIVTYLPPA